MIMSSFAVILIWFVYAVIILCIFNDLIYDIIKKKKRSRLANIGYLAIWVFFVLLERYIGIVGKLADYCKTALGG